MKDKMAAISMICDGDHSSAPADQHDWKAEKGPDEGVLEQSKSARVELFRPVYFYKRDEKQQKLQGDCLTSARSCMKESYCAHESCCKLFTSFLPPSQWLPTYAWRTCLIDDILAGLTVGIMAVSEGLAYAKLAGMPPISGLYTNTIPSLIYVLLGTCRHAIFGPLAALSVLTSGIRYKYIPCETCWTNNNVTTVQIEGTIPNVTPLELGSTIAFLVGCYLVVAGALRLSFLTNYLSDQVVGGFTIGVAVHMLSGQLGSILGIHLPSRRGIGKAIMGYIDAFHQIEETNFVTLTMFLLSFALLMVVKLFINPRIRRVARFQIPAELLVIACGTLASYFAQLHTRYGVKIIETIPAGLWIDCIAPAAVTYSLSISFAKVFARRNGYKIDPTQEFYAYGTMNLFGSFFQCINAGQSMARSIVNERSGAKSQISALVAVLIGIFVILLIAPFMEWLPSCILSSIVATACVLICSHITEVKDLYHWSKMDLSTYIVTAVSVAALDITSGLAAGAIWAMLTVVLRAQMSTVDRIPAHAASLYRQERLDGDGVDNIRVAEMRSPIFYANAERTRMKLLKIGEELIGRACFEGPGDSHNTREDIINGKVSRPAGSKDKVLIINMIGVPFMDPMGVNALKEVVVELKKHGIALFIGGCTATQHCTLQAAGFFDRDTPILSFPTLADAMNYAAKSI